MGRLIDDSLSPGVGRPVFRSIGDSGRRRFPQRPHEFRAIGEPLLGRLRECAQYGRTFAFRQGRDIRHRLEMLNHDLLRAAAGKRSLPRQQLLVNDGEAVLVAVPAELALEQLRGGVQRRDGAHRQLGLGAVAAALEGFSQTTTAG